MIIVIEWIYDLCQLASIRLTITGYSDIEDEDVNQENEVDKVDDFDDHPRVSLKQEDIELYYDIKEEIGK